MLTPTPAARNLLVTAINAEGGGGSPHVPAAPTLVVGIVAEGGGGYSPRPNARTLVTAINRTLGLGIVAAGGE